MTIHSPGLGTSSRGMLCSLRARSLSGVAMLVLITASAQAGTEASQPAARVPADAAVGIEGKCLAAVTNDQGVAKSESITASDSAVNRLTTTITNINNDPGSPQTEVLQEDKVWSTNLDRSSNTSNNNKNARKAPQCGSTAAIPPPTN